VGYTEEMLATNERIIYRTKLHWIAPVFQTIAGALLLLGGLALLVADGLFIDIQGTFAFIDTLITWAALLILLVGLSMVLFSYLQWYVEDYVVTNMRVLKISGILTKHSVGSSLEKINDVVMRQGPLGRIMGYGDLTVLTASEESNPDYRTMRNPGEFRRQVLDAKSGMDDEQIRDAIIAAKATMQMGAPATVAPPLRTDAGPSDATPAPAAAAPLVGGLTPTAEVAATAPIASGVPGVATAAPATAAPATAAPATAAPATPAPATTAPPAEPRADPAEVSKTLASLAELRDSGVITPEDYEAKKQDLLDRL
jgi:membrane protein YdbS with pleckstrin-like domain